MRTLRNLVRSILILTVFPLMIQCGDATSEPSIVGRYVSMEDGQDQEIVYHISHIRENLYGIKVSAKFEGEETQTDYLEASYNSEERMLTTKRSNVVLNYRFSTDYGTLELLGDENDMTLERR